MSAQISIYTGLVIGGFAATYVWRLMAVLAVSHINPDSEILRWVRAVATALVAALVMRLVIAPAGVLAETETWLRVAALASGLAAYWLFKRNVEIGVAVSVVILAAITFVL